MRTAPESVQKLRVSILSGRPGEQPIPAVDLFMNQRPDRPMTRRQFSVIE